MNTHALVHTHTYIYTIIHKKCEVFQLEPQVQQLKQDKDRIRHRAEYWKTRDQLRICFEEREVEEIIDK